MEQLIYQLIEQVNSFPRWSIFLATFLSGLAQVIFPPYPGELILALCGCIEYKRHLAESLILFFTYWAAIVAGNMALYTLGASKGEALLNSSLMCRWFTDKNKEKIKNWLKKYGLIVFLTAIYIPGMYLPTVFFSGVMKYRKRYAFTGMIIATLIHDIILFMGGRYMGGNISSIARFLTTYKYIALIIASSIVLLYVIIKIITHMKKSEA